MLQSMASLTRDSCVMLSPFRPVYARLVESRGGGFFGKGSTLVLQTDSVPALRRDSAGLTVLTRWNGGQHLDRRRRREGQATQTTHSPSRQWRRAGRGDRDGRLAVGRSRSRAACPRGREGGLDRGGERGPRLTGRSSCRACPAVDHSTAQEAGTAANPVVAAASRARRTRRTGSGDQINFVLLGTLGELDSAFAADWLRRLQTP
jgi:hypothetical protein